MVNNIRGECKGLPIIRVVSGVKFLVDTGSTSTIVCKEALNKLCKGKRTPQIRACGCKLVTLGGLYEVEGEVEIGLERWMRAEGKLRIHVVENMPREYGGIFGCDLFEKIGTRIRNRNGRWDIRLGRKRYRCEGVQLDGRVSVGVISQERDWRKILKEEYPDVFFREGEPLGATGRTVHEIPLKQERVVYVKERRYPQALREHIREEIQSLLDQGIVVPSTSPYNSPLWAVKKKHREGTGQEKYRVVVDFRKLNENTLDEKYPIPRFEDILDRLSGAVIFSTLDLKAGYHQIKMHPRDRHKTAFSFERGHFEFTRMPFGLKNAPITFQKFMDEFLRGLDEAFCQVYMDDLLVFSKTDDQHMDHLRRVFDRLRQFGLRLSEEKSILGEQRINFLGHTISAEGVRPDAQKVEAIGKMAIPTDIKGIRRLLGTLNYYRRFVPEMAKLLVPLNNLLKKGNKVAITPEIETNIRKCLSFLQKEPILAFPDFTTPFKITTDASEYALGAVLSQEEKTGERPVAYASRRLTETEARYSAIERELLGIVWAVDHFRPYIFGRKFEVHTDHRPLMWVGKLKESSARITRWKELLSQYNMEVTYKPGRENVVADWLSRALQVNAIDEDRGEHSRDLRQFISEWTPEGEGEQVPEGQEAEQGTSESDSTGEERPRDMEEMDDIVNDKHLQIIWKTRTSGLLKIEYTKYGKSGINTIWSEPGVREEQICGALKDASKPGKTHYLYVGNSTVWEKIRRLWQLEKIGVDRTFIRCKRIVETIKDLERQREVTLAHHQGKTNHRGVNETLQALKRRYFWWNMRKVIEEVVGQCAVCQITKYDRHPPKGKQEDTPTPIAPLTDLQVDTFTWRTYKWVTIMDIFSRAAMAYPVQNRSADAVLEALKTWFQFYGVPIRIASDGGREFDNASIRKETRALDIEWHINTPGHPKSRGGIERLHSTLGDHLRVYHVDKGLEPHVAMPRAITAYNHSIHSATGFSPFEMLFGLRGRQRDPTATMVDEETADTLLNNRLELTEIWKKAHRKITKEKSKRVARENMAVRDRLDDIRIGSVVYRKLGSNRGKEIERYEGPFRVVGIREHNIVMIQSIKEPRKRRNVHIEQLKIPVGVP